ncbi:MAG: hypothetical protein H0U31_10090 [Chloroflexia bacterium]|nr:hypothetical protein [Chloroflexia bacterium]
MAQTDPAHAFDQRLVERVIAWLQTRDTTLFPFTARFDSERERAFARDLQVGLSDLTESGAKRGTSASGFLVSDKRLEEIVDEWAAAGGEWPKGTNPSDANTSLAAVTRASGN